MLNYIISCIASFFAGWHGYLYFTTGDEKSIYIAILCVIVSYGERILSHVMEE